MLGVAFALLVRVFVVVLHDQPTLLWVLRIPVAPLPPGGPDTARRAGLVMSTQRHIMQPAKCHRPHTVGGVDVRTYAACCVLCR
jgi:hypothetical protein